MQYGEQQRQPIRFEADRDSAGIHALRFVGQRLHFDQHRSTAFTRHHHGAAGDRLRDAAREKSPKDF